MPLIQDKAGQNRSATYLLSLITRLFIGGSLFLTTSCPGPPDNEFECGVHQIEINGTCECEEGYHWNEDETQCLLDTTSHEFVWEIDTMGNYGSYLMDVAIIDENNVWVVGYIETDSGTYNTAHWDGSEWEFILIDRVVDFDGIYAFSENEIWFSDGCYIYFFDGLLFSKKWECDWESYGIGQAKTIWGSSLDDVYFVGNNGSIAHYDGIGFVRMESGTEIDLQSVIGTPQEDFWATGYQLSESVILSYNGSIWHTEYERNNTIPNTTLPTDQLLLSISGIWTNSREDSLWVIGSWGIFRSSKASPRYARLVVPRRWDLPNYTFGFPNEIQGVMENQIFVVGKKGTVYHYNGNTWHNYEEFMEEDRIFWGVDVTEKMAVFVGETLLGKAIVVRGYQ